MRSTLRSTIEIFQAANREPLLVMIASIFPCFSRTPFARAFMNEVSFTPGSKLRDIARYGIFNGDIFIAVTTHSKRDCMTILLERCRFAIKSAKNLKITHTLDKNKSK